MNEQTAITSIEKHSLREMLSVKNLLLDCVYENFGEISDEQVTVLSELEIRIPEKIDGWAWTLTNNGAIDKEIELWQQRKEVIENVIKTLKNGKERLKVELHRIMAINGAERLDGNQFWIKKTISENRSVALEKVEKEYLKYQMPVMTYSEYSIFDKILRLNEEKLKELYTPDEIPILKEIGEKLSVELHTKCNVTDLPNDHQAIKTEEKQSVRIYNQKK